MVLNLRDLSYRLRRLILWYLGDLSYKLRRLILWYLGRPTCRRR